MIWVARMTRAERACLAWAALRSLPEDIAHDTAEAALGGPHMPWPSPFNRMHAARFWAERATPAELEAHVFAAFEAMAPARQAAFLAYVGKGAAA